MQNSWRMQKSLNFKEPTIPRPDISSIFEDEIIISKIIEHEIIEKVWFEIQKRRARQRLQEDFKKSILKFSENAYKYPASIVLAQCQATLHYQEDNTNLDDVGVLKPAIDTWARKRIMIHKQYKEIDLIVPEPNIDKQANLRISILSQRRTSSRQLGQLKKLKLTDPFKLDEEVSKSSVEHDIRCLKDSVEVVERGILRSEKDERFVNDLRHRKDYRDLIVREMIKTRKGLQLPDKQTKALNHRDLQLIRSNRIPFTTDYTGVPILVKKGNLAVKAKTGQGFYRLPPPNSKRRDSKKRMSKTFNHAQSVPKPVGVTKHTGQHRGQSFNYWKEKTISRETSRDSSMSSSNTLLNRDSDIIRGLRHQFSKAKKKLFVSGMINGTIQKLKEILSCINPTPAQVYAAKNQLAHAITLSRDNPKFQEIEELKKMIRMGKDEFERVGINTETIYFDTNVSYRGPRIEMEPSKDISQKEEESKRDESHILKGAKKLNKFLGRNVAISRQKSQNGQRNNSRKVRERDTWRKNRTDNLDISNH